MLFSSLNFYKYLREEWNIKILLDDIILSDMRENRFKRIYSLMKLNQVCSINIWGFLGSPYVYWWRVEGGSAFRVFFLFFFVSDKIHWYLWFTSLFLSDNIMPSLGHTNFSKSDFKIFFSIYNYLIFHLW